MGAFPEALDSAKPEHHLVQFYQADERVLTENVTRFLTEGWEQGQSLLSVATPEHNEAFAWALRRNRVDVDGAGDRIVFLDAKELLSHFLSDGHPNAERFDRSVGETVRAMLDKSESRGLRVYGEMVGILWKQRQFPAAIRLEQLWDSLLRTQPFHLFCGYPIDIFDKQFDGGIVDALLCAHSHLLSAGDAGTLENAIVRATDEVLGPDVFASVGVMPAIARSAWGGLPRGETMILWLRKSYPQAADSVLERAREYYLSV